MTEAKRTLVSPKQMIFFGLFLVCWPMVAAFLSGLLFAQGLLATYVARICYFAALSYGTPSMIVGLAISLWGVGRVLWLRQATDKE